MFWFSAPHDSQICSQQPAPVVPSRLETAFYHLCGIVLLWITYCKLHIDLSRESKMAPTMHAAVIALACASGAEAFRGGALSSTMRRSIVTVRSAATDETAAPPSAVWADVPLGPADPILGLAEAFNLDGSPNKVRACGAPPSPPPPPFAEASKSRRRPPRTAPPPTAPWI